MKSIKTKIILVLSLCILISSVSVGGAGIVSAWKMVKQDASQIMQLYCQDKALEINMLLKNIEQSVESVSDFAIGELGDMQRFQSEEDYINAYTEKIRKVLLNAAVHTEGAMGVYIRYNPDFTDSMSGFFYSKESVDGNFIERTPTDLSLYDSTETEYVGWYYQPIINKKPTWMQPYWNENVDSFMISYVIPLEMDGIVVGVMGMDIDFSVLTQKVDDVKLYQNSYAFLTNEKGNIVYHKDYDKGTPLLTIDSGLKDLVSLLETPDGRGKLVELSIQGEQCAGVFEPLNNEMTFVLIAMSDEISALHFELFMRIILITLLVSIVTFVITYIVSSKMAKPLIELNVAAKKIADGNLDVVITHHSEDEIGVLAESFRKTVNKLREYIEYMKGLAYLDPLTGMKSKTAYFEMIQRINEGISTELKEFAVIVFDINELKLVNDKYGHDKGDCYIIEASKVIYEVFHHIPIYRIGGDEFVTILMGTDMELYEKFLMEFDERLKFYNLHAQKELELVVARGIAFYVAGKDISYQSVFKRADAAMYEHKNALKASGAL